MDRFKDKVVFITGSASGIGKAITLAFAQEGAILVATDKNGKALEVLKRDLKDLRVQRKVYPMDVTKKDEISRVFEDVNGKLGRIDVVVNDAGVSTMNSILDLTEEEWDLNMDVNAKGTFLCSQSALRYMIPKRKGKIVNVASMAGKIGAPFLSHYSASKFAVVGFTQAIALEVAPYGINVNAVCPGYVRTSMQDREVVWEAKLRGIKDPEEVRKGYIQQTPFGRLCSPEDVARVVLFLASEDADFITGQALNVTGGLCMH